MTKIFTFLFLSLVLLTTSQPSLFARGGGEGGRGGGVGANFGGSRSIGGQYGDTTRAQNLENDYNNINNGGGGDGYYQQPYVPPPAPNPNAQFDSVPINPPEPPL